MLKPRPARPAVASDTLPPDARGPQAATPNDQEMTVSALAGALKRTVEDRFGYVRVRGEISNYRGPHSSGHAYFCLKDDGARIDAVIWKTTLLRLKTRPEEGLDVIASGKITTFPGKSAYQIVIETLEMAGVGALMAALEERRRRLAAEGLFDAGRKRAIPYLPAVIGVVTSPTGAVIRDILHRIAGRFASRVLVWPVRVQGETSAEEVTRAIAGFNALGEGGSMPAPSVIIVARGGGSLEDLWSFNDEALVRAAAASRIPLISAIGHETDWTLLDHVADLRAPTPTGAAELAVPVLLDLAVAIDRLEGRQTAALLRLLDDRQRALRAAARLLPSAADLLATRRQRLDGAAIRLPAALDGSLAQRRLALARLSGRLSAQAPRTRLGRLDQHLAAVTLRLRRATTLLAQERTRRVQVTGDRFAVAFTARLRLAAEQGRTRRRQVHDLDRRLASALVAAAQRRAARLAALHQLLAGLSYRSVLDRGFALVRDGDGHAVRRVSALPEGGPLSLEFADGRVAVQRGEAAALPPRVRPPKVAAGRPAGRQGSLF